MRVTKFGAASQQLTVAIRLLFADQSPLAVRTLIAAAATVLADLSECRNHGRSWRSRQVAAARQLNIARPYDVLHAAVNFLKHADRDTDAEFDFDVTENEDATFMATLECGDLGPTSHEMQVFQIWYMAAYPEKFGAGFEHTVTAVEAYPTLRNDCRSRRLAIGREMLRELRSNNPLGADV